MLLKPKIKLEKVTDITPQILNKYGIKGLILDVDNTLSTHHGEVLTDGLLSWLDFIKANGFSVIVLSNSKEKRVSDFAKKINLNYISMGLKPLPFGYLKAARKLGLRRKECVIIGDQIFTDVLGGNFVGVKTLLLTPIKPEDGWSFKLRRRLEKIIFKIYKIKNTETMQ